MTRFSRQPCIKCKEDTLHYAGRCRMCGHTAVSTHGVVRQASVLWNDSKGQFAKRNKQVQE